MAEVGELSVAVKLNERSVDEAGNQITKSMKRTGDEVENSLGSKFGNVLKLLAVEKIVAGFKTIAEGAITLAGNLEQAKIAFTTMLGSGAQAQTLLTSLSTFAQNTPFELTGIRETSKQLLAYGIDANSIIPTLKALGDVSAGLSVPIQQVALAYGQVKTAGVLLGQDLRQFTSAGVPLIAELSKNLGVAQSKIKDMVSDGKIKFEDVQKAFVTMSSAGGKFANLMDSQSKTLQGSRSNLKDSVSSLGETFGTLFVPALTKLVQTITPLIASLKDRAQENPNLARGVVLVVTGIVGLLSVLTAVNAVLPFFSGGLRLLQPLLSMLGLSTTALLGPLGILLTLGTALVVMYSKNTFGLRNWIDEMRGVSVEQQVLTESAKEHMKAIDELTEAQRQLDAQLAMGSITKEEYAKKTSDLEKKLKTEYATVNGLSTLGYDGLAQATQRATDAKQRLEQMKLNPNVTVEALKTEANSAIATAQAFLFVASAKAKALAGSIGASFDPANPQTSQDALNAIKSGAPLSIKPYDGSVEKNLGVVQADANRRQLDSIATQMKESLGTIKSAQDDIKNAQKIVDNIKSANGGGGSGKGGAKKELDELKAPMDNIEKQYKAIQKANEDFGDSVKKVRDKAVKFNQDIADGLGEIKKKQNELTKDFDKTTADNNKSFLRQQAENQVSMQNELVDLEKQKQEAQNKVYSGDGSQKDVDDIQKQIDAKKKELDFLKSNIAKVGTPDQVKAELARAGQNPTEQAFADFQEQENLRQKEFQEKQKKLEDEAKIYKIFQDNKFTSTRQIQKLMSDEVLKNYTDEQQALILKLGRERLELEQQKQDAIKQQQDIADATVKLSNDVNAIHIENIKKVKQEYVDLITTINNALVAQQSLNNAQSSTSKSLKKGFASGGYTGDGPVGQVAGEVHGQEYVLSKPMLDSMPGIIPLLEKARQGDMTDLSRKFSVGSINVEGGMGLKSFIDYMHWKMK